MLNKMLDKEIIKKEVMVYVIKSDQEKEKICSEFSKEADKSGKNRENEKKLVLIKCY